MGTVFVCVLSSPLVNYFLSQLFRFVDYPLNLGLLVVSASVIP